MARNNLLQLSVFETRQQAYRYECVEVNSYCPVEETVLGYYPNLGVNVFLLVGYSLCFFGIVTVGVLKKTWGYSAAIAAGSALEVAGYVGRLMLHHNPWDEQAFELQVCAIILGPTIICISIYLTIKHVTLSLSPELSRVRPRLYPYIFVPADVSCLILQAIGGSIAATATSPNLANSNFTALLAGDRVIIVGIALQVFILLSFGTLVVDYVWRTRKWIRSPDVTPEALVQWEDRKFRRYALAATTAYCCILIRCMYRIAEMAGGWGNFIMKDQPSFVVLEGFMILIPVCLLTLFQPGYLFPAMAERESQLFRRKMSTKEDNVNPPEVALSPTGKALEAQFLDKETAADAV